MDTLEKLRNLQKQRGWTDYRLARESGLSDSTIINIYRRNALPSIPTLEAICRAFGLTLSQFFAEGDLVELSPELNELFDQWKTLTPDQKRVTLEMMKVFNARLKI